MDDVRKSLLRQIPSVDSVLGDSRLDTFRARLGAGPVADAVRATIEAFRARIVDETSSASESSELSEAIASETAQRLEDLAAPFYRAVVNATGIILHTGLGRAVLAAKALEQVQETLQGYSLLQLDRETGKRSARDERIEWLLQRLTGAEAATVVNNNAAATAIVLNTVALKAGR